MKKAGVGWGRERTPKTSWRGRKFGHSHSADVKWAQDLGPCPGDLVWATPRTRLLLLLLEPRGTAQDKGLHGRGKGFESRFQFTGNWGCERTLERRGMRRWGLIFSSS